MNLLVAAVLPLFLMPLGLSVLWVAEYVKRSREKKRSLCSPLTADLLRPAGHSLQLKIKEELTEFSAVFAFIMILAPLALAMHLSLSYLGGVEESAIRTTAFLLIVIITYAIFGGKYLRIKRKLYKLRLGLDGEMFVGRELDQLMRDGCYVFHDLPFPYGNIDHVVVSPAGVFAVETKMRTKKGKEADRSRVKIDYANDIYLFPQGPTRIDVSQLESQRRWLSETLSEATGNRVGVVSILALPGWYVEPLGRFSSYQVINPRNSRQFFLSPNTCLSPELMKQIAYQLDRLCRDVTPIISSRKVASSPAN